MKHGRDCAQELLHLAEGQAAGGASWEGRLSLRSQSQLPGDVVPWFMGRQLSSGASGSLEKVHLGPDQGASC